jgi:NTP pyrophosphatase (non-canonical NTP hydrolase)
MTSHSPDAESGALAPGKCAKIGEELAVVLLYLIRLADKLDIDLATAAAVKLRINAEKYLYKRRVVEVRNTPNSE